MAEAWLVPWHKNDQGEVVVHVRNNGCSGWPVDAARLLFGRRWGSPRFADAKVYFEYRALADEICTFLADRAAKGRRLGRSRVDRHVADWLSNAAEALAERGDDISQEDALDDERMRALVLERVTANPECVFEIDSTFHAHGRGVCTGDGTDVEFEIAAEALDLPRWARREIQEEGGLGSGYAQAAVVLKPDHTFADLVDWLHRVARRR